MLSVSKSGNYEFFVIFFFFLRWGVVTTSPIPQTGGPPLVCCPWLLIRYVRSCCPYWRPLHHPKPEDAPCHGDKDRDKSRCRQWRS